MGFLQRLAQSDGSVSGVIAALLPGRSSAMKVCRDQAVHLCEDIAARGALITGNYGAGKTTLARVVALGRFVHLLSREAATQLLRQLQGVGTSISPESVPWFLEFPVPSLTAGHAAAQLFGFAPNTFADAPAGGRGLFERASRGGIPDDARDASIPEGALGTGGVVLLDEIGDLPADLQPKLLAVVAGHDVHRYGAEGSSKYRFAFKGLTIGATWRPLETLRADLVSRLEEHVLQVPSLNERHEDLSDIALGLVDEIRDRHTKLVADIRTERFPAANPAALVPPKFPELNAEDIAGLGKIDWSVHGEVRGLSQVLSLSARAGISVAAAAQAHREIRPPGSSLGSISEHLLDRVLEMEVDRSATAKRTVETVLDGVRRGFAEYVEGSPERLSRLAEKLSKTVPLLKKELYELKRR